MLDQIKPKTFKTNMSFQKIISIDHVLGTRKLKEHFTKKFLRFKKPL